ncbi:MAG: restriction endonuclease, partial [Coriobacteriales bacterium]
YNESVIRNEEYFFSECISYNDITSGDPSLRFKSSGQIFNDAGPSIFADRNTLIFLLGFGNTSVLDAYAKLLAPTIHFTVGEMASVPVVFCSESINSTIRKLVLENIELSRYDWDSFETSWDFLSHPLAQRNEKLISAQFNRWSSECQKRFYSLKSNEEELNSIFARLYHMEGEVSIEVPNDKVSVRLADKERDVKSLISYAVGCMFGRYSIDADGLILADQGATVEDYLQKVPNSTFMPDDDNVIPILDTDWFEDDIVTRFYQFLAAAYGAEALDKNVTFIEEALGKDIRSYFVKDFYKDHWHTYQKRPIYWLFQSPKKSFSCLIYMHRYTEGTAGEMLTRYLRPFEEKLRNRIDLLQTSEHAKNLKEASKLQEKLKEIEDWERDVVYPLAHERVSIGLDDGVKVNYNKFPHALAKIPGLSDWK